MNKKINSKLQSLNLRCHFCNGDPYTYPADMICRCYEHRNVLISPLRKTPKKIPDDIIVGLSNHFTDLRLAKLEGKELTPSEQEGVEAFEALIRWIYLRDEP